MSDLKNTLAHILEHKHHLEDANEATTQQYVVLPILQALGWEYTNLASMEVVPEYQVESKRADYALHVKHNQSPVVLVECKRWNEPITRHAEQICFYAYSRNIPLALITNGRRWRFYLSGWKAESLSDRIFCEIDIENGDRAVFDLETYLLKSNVASDEAALNAEIALEEKEKVAVPKPEPSNAGVDRKDNITDNEPPQQVVPSNFPYSGAQLRAMREQAGLTQVQVALALDLAKGSSAAVGDWEAERLKVPAKHQAKLRELYSTTGDALKSESSASDVDHEERQSGTTVPNKWTGTRVRDLLSEEVRAYHETHFPEDRRNLFYRRVAEIQNLIEAEEWRLNPPKVNKGICSFFLTDKGITRVKRTFGICLQPFLPHASPVGRNGEKIPTHSLTSNPPRVFAKITEEEARDLEHQYGCKFSCASQNQIYYDIPDDVRELLPVFEFAYHKHRGN